MRNLIHMIIIIIIMLACFTQSSYALDIDMIFYVRGDTYTSDMGYSVFSPGDLDGDGYSEVFVGAWGNNLVKVFDGGLVPSTVPQKIYEHYSGNFKWLDDLNDDGYDDLAMYRRAYGEPAYVDLYFGCADFYSKNGPDIIFPYESNKGFGDAIRSADADNDGYNELIISASHTDYPLDGTFYIYEIYGSADSIPDDSIVIVRTPEESYFVYGDCLGDINGDGYADYGTTPAANSRPSFVAIYYGDSELDAEADHIIWSPFDDAPGVGHFGGDIVGLGDINKDSFDDFAVLSDGFPACIFYGGSPFDTIPKILQELGETVNVCGDINNDGWEDLVFGQLSYAYGSGAVVVYFG
jgi:hypothetical protein